MSKRKEEELDPEIDPLREENNLPLEPPHPALMMGGRSKRKFSSLEEEIEEAMKVMASIIADDGQEYLPVFERLEQELKKCRTKNGVLQRALKLAGER